MYRVNYNQPVPISYIVCEMKEGISTLRLSKLPNSDKAPHQNRMPAATFIPEWQVGSARNPLINM